VTFPLLFEVGVHTWDGVEDSYNTEAGYTPARDVDGTQYEVYGWSTPATQEPKLAGHDRVEVDVELLVPPDFPVGPHDLVDLPDVGQFEVIGYPEDFTKGPFGFQPGAVVNLRRVEG
jgi:hypothetical protein